MATALIQRSFGADLPAPVYYSALESALQPPSLTGERGLNNTAFMGIVEGSEDWATEWWRSLVMDQINDDAIYNPESNPARVTNPLYTEPSSFDIEASMNTWDVAVVMGVLVIGVIIAVKVW